jgi:lipoprotein-anchoring transpeptidase ErfK/SrfK
MVDYYSILAKAMDSPDAADAQWRRGVYDRARDMLAKQLQARRPPAPRTAIAAEQAALDAAIRRLEADMSRPARRVSARNEPADDDRADDRTMTGTFAIEPEPDRMPIAKPFRMSSATWIVLAVVAAAIGAGGYVWYGAHKAAPPPAKIEASNPAPAKPAEPAAPKPVLATTKDGDLPPGVDGTADTEISYVFRRQPTFYRTLQPVGTVIVDKLQHFLYLIQPNNVALRYGVGVGGACTDLAGLRHIASKAEWPSWDATPDMIAKKLAKPGTMAGGPGNPLGARDFELDDHTSRINGTNAPKTIGTVVVFGCIRMVNEDIVDLYNRVPVGTPVILN